MNVKLEEMANLLLKDQDLAKDLMTKTPEEAQTWFKSKGCDVTLEDVNEFAKKLNALIEAKTNDEISELDLEDVAGGGSSGWWFAAGCLATVAVICCPW